MTIRAVCFDATGTLIEPWESVGTVYARAALAQGIKLPAWRLDDAFVRVLRGSPPLAGAGVCGASRAEREAAELAWWLERVRQVFQATDSTVEFPDPKGFARALFETWRGADVWRVRAGARELLAVLEAAGLRLGLASHFDHRLPEILESLDLLRFFEILEIPSRHGRAKPDRAVFEAVAEALGASLDELAYVGDDAPEVLAAIEALGLRIFDVHALPDLGAVAIALGAVPHDAARRESGA